MLFVSFSTLKPAVVPRLTGVAERQARCAGSRSVVACPPSSLWHFQHQFSKSDISDFSSECFVNIHLMFILAIRVRYRSLSWFYPGNHGVQEGEAASPAGHGRAREAEWKVCGSVCLTGRFCRSAQASLCSVVTNSPGNLVAYCEGKSRLARV